MKGMISTARVSILKLHELTYHSQQCSRPTKRPRNGVQPADIVALTMHRDVFGHDHVFKDVSTFKQRS